MSIDLAVQQPLSASLQTVQDQNDNPSSLAISSSQVCIGTTTPSNPSLLTVSGAIGPGPIASMLSQGSEASIAYQDSSQIFWTAGSGGVGPGLQSGTYFIWNSQAGQAVLTIDPAGTLTLLAGSLSIPNGSMTVSSIQANDITATSITASSLTVNVPATPDSTAAPNARRLVPLAVDPETGKIYLQR